MYRSNLIASSLGYLTESVATFFSIWLIFSQTNVLGQWKSSEMFALFAYTLLLMTIWEFFLVNTLEIPYLINNGELDVFLLRPVSLLYQFIIFELDEEALFELVTSLGMLLFAISISGPNISIMSFALFIGGTLSAILSLQALYLAISSSAFWFQSADGLRSIAYQVLQFNRYPLSIYPRLIQTLMTILPFGMYGYFPLHVFLFPNTSMYEILYSLLAGPVFLLISYNLCWKQGLKNIQVLPDNSSSGL